MNMIIYAAMDGWQVDNPQIISEQTVKCRCYAQEQENLKVIKCFQDKNAERNIEKELEKALELLENRKADGLILASIRYFFHNKADASFYISKVMIPAGIRLICVDEKIDTYTEEGRNKLSRIFRKADGNGKSQQKKLCKTSESDCNGADMEHGNLCESI